MSQHSFKKEPVDEPIVIPAYEASTMLLPPFVYGDRVGTCKVRHREYRTVLVENEDGDTVEVMRRHNKCPGGRTPPMTAAQVAALPNPDWRALQSN